MLITFLHDIMTLSRDPACTVDQYSYLMAVRTAYILSEIVSFMLYFNHFFMYFVAAFIISSAFNFIRKQYRSTSRSLVEQP
jgi:hypothetical protein